MNFVQPIRQQSLLQDIAAYLKRKNERDYILFMVGIYTGLRISDILKLRVSDLKNKDYIVIREKKTGKQQTMEINPILKRELAKYIISKGHNEYLIKSRQNQDKPMTRGMAYKILQDVAMHFGLQSIGCHTLRKTFGYHFYQQYKDAVILQEHFNHSHISVTLRYIGIEQENKDNAIRKLKLF